MNTQSRYYHDTMDVKMMMTVFTGNIAITMNMLNMLKVIIMMMIHSQ